MLGWRVAGTEVGGVDGMMNPGMSWTGGSSRTMEVIYPSCAGLDVHKETVVACVRIAEGGESVRMFATATAWKRQFTGNRCGRF